MDESAPEESLVGSENERIDALGDAFLATGDPQAIEEELDEEEDPIEPMDV